MPGGVGLGPDSAIPRKIEVAATHRARLFKIAHQTRPLNRLSGAVLLKEAANWSPYCDPSTVCASSHFLFLKRLRKEEAICRRSFRSDDPRGSDRAYRSIWRRN
jgi:hypothetical protein